MSHDLRLASRRLARTPGFTAAAVLTLALGIGANTAIFGLLHSVVLRPLPYPQPDRLVAIELMMRLPSNDVPFSWSYPRFDHFRELARSYEAMAAFVAQPVSFTAMGDPERILNESVNAAYFELLGARAQLGRTFTPSDDDAAAEPGVILSDALWRRRFGADPGVIGSRIRLNEYEFTVVGVMAATFRPLANGTDLWTPLVAAPRLRERPALLTQVNSGWLNAMGRLADNVTIEQAASELNDLRPRLEERHPSPANTPFFPRVRALLDAKIDPAIRSAAWILFAAAGVVLLITCTNLAGLLLTRAAARSRELAIRRAIGATRSALVRLTLAETALLALLGGAAGLLLASWSMDLLTSLQPERLRGFWASYARAIDQGSVHLNSTLVAFNSGVAALTAAFFGLMPAWLAARVEIGDVLRATSAAPGRSQRMRRLGPRAILIVSQLVLAIILVSGASLVLNSFSRLLATQIGAVTDRLLTFAIDLPTARYPDERAITFQQQLLARLEQLRGVEAAAITNTLPVSGQTAMSVAAPTPLEASTPVSVHSVSPRFFELMGIALREGRFATASEHTNASPVALISQSAARDLFPAGNAVGSLLRMAGIDSDLLIVGVVADVKYENVEQAAGSDVYISTTLRPLKTSFVLVKTAGNELALLDQARQEVLALDAQLPIFDARSMAARVRAAVSRTRFSATLLGLFALLALVLAAVGVYGVINHSSRSRARDIGIRMALGAHKRRILRETLGDGLFLAAVALVIGVPAALASTRVLQAVLFGVTPHDPFTFIAVIMTILAVGLSASWLPARRAAKTDPMTVLRSD